MKEHAIIVSSCTKNMNITGASIWQDQAILMCVLHKKSCLIVTRLVAAPSYFQRNEFKFYSEKSKRCPTSMTSFVALSVVLVFCCPAVGCYDRCVDIFVFTKFSYMYLIVMNPGVTQMVTSHERYFFAVEHFQNLFSYMANIRVVLVLWLKPISNINTFLERRNH